MNNKEIKEVAKLDDAYGGSVSLVAFSKNGKRFFQNNLEIGKQTEKAVLINPIGAEECITTIDMQWWLPISQIKKVEKISYNGCEFYDIEIPMWLFGKMFFE